MDKIRLTKQFEFEAAHSLIGYDGACKYIHGHSYVLYVTIIGIPSADLNNPKLGMVMDFGSLKQIVNENIVSRFDHCLMLKQDSPLSSELKAEYKKVEIFEFQPTCENMLLYFVSLLEHKMPENIALLSIKLHETGGSYAEWYKTDQL